MYKVNYYNTKPKSFFANDSKALIGYLRGDFGQNGYEFYSSFFDKNEELKTDEFRSEFNKVVDTLRSTILRDRYSVRGTMIQNPTCKLETDIGTSYGVFVESEKYEYAVRLIADSCNYDFYIQCYDKSLLEPEYTNSKRIKEENVITLGDMLKSISFEDIHMVHADEEIELATIVELKDNTLTQSGKEHWKDVLDAKVTKIYEGAYGLQLECTDVEPERLKEFSMMLAGYVDEKLYDEWVNDSDDGVREEPTMNL